MTQARLERLTKLWQKRLRIQDWEVRVSLMTAQDRPDAFGHTDIDITEMRADVRVRDDDNAEATLVHELLHLRLICFGVDDDDAKQTAMNLLADAFMRAYRR